MILRSKEVFPQKSTLLSGEIWTEGFREIYASLDRYPDSPSNEEQLIVIAYYLHNLYSAFESVFQHIAEAFENQVDDRSGWHAELLHRMTLEIEGVRPRLLGPETYDSLDELRRFRHLFRSAYRIHLDPERLHWFAKRQSHWSYFIIRTLRVSSPSWTRCYKARYETQQKRDSSLESRFLFLPI